MQNRFLIEIYRLIADKRGNAQVVEFAVLLPLILGVFLSSLFFLSANRIDTVLQMAVKAGAREYRVTESVVLGKKKVEQELQLGGVPGVRVTVQGEGYLAEKDYGFYLPIFDRYTFHLSAYSEFQKEYDPKFYLKDYDPENPNNEN